MANLPEQHHLQARIDGEQITLTQVNKRGVYSSILLAPHQLLELAAQVKGIASPNESERRLAVIAGELSLIVNDPIFRADLIERIARGSTWLAQLDGVMALATEYHTGLAPPEPVQSNAPLQQSAPLPAKSTTSHTQRDLLDGDTYPSPAP